MPNKGRYAEQGNARQPANEHRRVLGGRNFVVFICYSTLGLGDNKVHRMNKGTFHLYLLLLRH